MAACVTRGANLALVGRMHRCIPRPKPQPVINIAEVPKTALLTSNADRQAKWRNANAELNKQRARDGMRKRRAKPKD